MAIKAAASLVPRHYSVSVKATPDSMLRLVLGLRRLVYEFEAGEELEQLLATLEEAYVGDLPSAPAAPLEGGEPPAQVS